MRCIRIGSVQLPAPAYGDGYKYTVNALDASSGTGRNKFTGDAFRQKIASKRTVEISYNALSPALIKAVLDELDVEGVGTAWLACEVLNPRTGQMYSGTFYCADYSVALESNIPGRDPIWTGLAFTLVEQ